MGGIRQRLPILVLYLPISSCPPIPLHFGFLLGVLASSRLCVCSLLDAEALEELEGSQSRLGGRDEVALEAVAALEEGEMGLGLDALGHHVETEVVAEPDDRLGHRAVVDVGLDIADERPIDLQAVQRELGEVGERRESGPEVVDGDADPGELQLLEDRAGASDVAHQEALGDLELQLRGGKARCRERLRDPLDQVRTLELPRREVHRESEIRKTPPLPASDLGGRRLEHPGADGVDEAGGLYKQYELL